MKRKTTYLLLGVLLALLGLWWGQRSRQARTTTQQAVRQPLVENFQAEMVDTIEILPGKNRGKLRAFRQDSRWMLQGTPPLPADATAADRLLNAIRRAEINRVVALTRDNLDQFGMDEEQRATVRLLGGEITLYEFWLGASAEDYLSAYVTRLNDPKVYYVENFTREDIAREWRDLTALQFDGAKATQIAYAQPRGGFTLARNTADEWTLDGRPTKPEVIKELVRELSSLRAENITAAHATFTPSGVTIEINTPSGTQALLLGQTRPDGGVFAKTSAGYFYTLSKTTKGKILPARRALLK